MDANSTICRLCGTRGSCEEIPRLRSVDKRILILTGVVPSLLHTASRKTDVRCDSCGARFSIRTPLAVVCLLLFWGLIVTALALVAIAFVDF
jgi:hypothetical protein